MKKNRFSLVNHPWLFLLVFILATIVINVLISILLIGVLKLPGDAPITGLWVNILLNSLMAFVFVPFVMGMRDRSQPYKAYLSEIRLTNWKPVLQLLILGISSYLFLALSQFAATLIFRLSQGLVIDAAFFSSAFPIESEFPPNSLGFLVSLISVFEEVAFRGVILTLFLRHYNQTKAVLFSALGFGVIHVFNFLGGQAPLWVTGQIVWATFMGLFYAYITLKTSSLLPAMLVHYLGNLSIYPLTAYIQNNASVKTQVLFGVTLTLGILPVVMMSLWVQVFTSRWLMNSET